MRQPTIQFLMKWRHGSKSGDNHETSPDNFIPGWPCSATEIELRSHRFEGSTLADAIAKLSQQGASTLVLRTSIFRYGKRSENAPSSLPTESPVMELP